jgi:hypothetical protein
VTYLFFQRDSGENDNGPGLSPSIQSTRVIRHGGAAVGGRLRSGSMPPVSLRAGSMPSPRAGSVMRGGSVVPVSNTTITSSSSSGGGGGGGGFRGGGVPQHRSARGGSNVILGVRADGSTGPLHPAVTRRRASISVAPSAAAAYRPRTAAAVNTGVRLAPTTNHNRQQIFRAEDFLSGSSSSSSSSSSKLPPLSVTVDGPRFARRSSTLPPAAATSYRRASVSSGPSPAFTSYIPRSRTTTTTTTTRNLVQDTAPRRAPAAMENGDVTTTTYKRSSSAALTVDRRPDFERERESLANLRQRTNKARDQLSRHRILLDRYLPLQLGPSGDVSYEVDYKVTELYPRMPYLDPTRPRQMDSKFDNYESTGPVLLIQPYKPVEWKTRVEPPPAAPIRTTFTPKMSDTRKRARQVLCKVKGDPHYFDF